MTSIRVGFEVPTGREVRVEPHHVGVTGLTQRSGKTTLLEALMDRANETAIAFRTSRGEIGFRGAKRIAPYFRPRTDWRFVEGLISAHLMEKAKFYRADLIRLTRGTKTLADVHANVRAALAKARPGSFPEKILTELNEYLAEIREALDQVRFAPEPDLTPMALSVMDLEGLKPAIQQLVIAATVDWLMEGHLTVPVVVVLPEARDFIPEDRRTPAKLALEDLIRKGARVHRYLWLDSQALTGLDMDVCRSIGTWFFGRQTLDIECRRVARMIPGKKVRPDDVQALALGQFYLQQGEDVTRVYVQPDWLPDPQAIMVAKGETQADELAGIFNRPTKEQEMDDKERKQYEERINQLEAERKEQVRRETVLIDRNTELARQVKTEHDRAEANARAAADNAIERIHRSVPVPGSTLQVTSSKDGKTTTESVPLDNPEGGPSRRPPSPSELAPATIGDRQMPVPERVDLHVAREFPDLTIHTKVWTINATDADHRGKLAILLHEGFFDDSRSTGPIGREYASRGWGNPTGGNSASALRNSLQELCAWGFLREFKSMYRAVPGVKERIRVAEEKAVA